jgi:hypothetical protein
MERVWLFIRGKSILRIRMHYNQLVDYCAEHGYEISGTTNHLDAESEPTLLLFKLLDKMKQENVQSLLCVSASHLAKE